MHECRTILIGLGALALMSCQGEAGDGEVGVIATTPDPLVARALNDPLMVDPDLISTNEANAALSIRYDHALPPYVANGENSKAAADAATNELLASGPLVDLPLSSGKAQSEALALGMTADEIIAATGAPSRCVGKLTEGLAWAARMPDAARVMPHGMAMQAAGAEQERCKIRIVRYVTPAGIEDALRYHFIRADRAGMMTKRYNQPEAVLDAERGSQHFKVYTRPGPNGTTAVDLIYWRR